MGRTRFAGIALAVLGMVALGGCGADPSDGTANGDNGGNGDVVSNKITGSVYEWGVDVSAGRAEAGEVIFAIANFGSIPHEFLVAKTTFEPGKIPLGENDRFDEELDGIDVIDEIKEWNVNKAEVLKINLEPGNYELLCNLAGHYRSGMHVAFEVVEGDAAGESEGGDGETSTDGDAVSNDITGSVSEWNIGVSANESLAGEVNFSIKNEGAIAHEFLVAKTTFGPGEIPLGEDNRFDESLEGIEVIDEIKEWDPGLTKDLSVNLEPGTYELLCNIAGHYKSGMHTMLTVREASTEDVVMKNDVTGEVKDFAIGIDAGGAKSGDVRFSITNNGAVAHEFLVVKTEIEAGMIPLTEEKKFSEDNPDLTVIDEIPEWEPGETKTLTVKLDPGNYQIVCNIVDHYKAGMWLPFIVTQ